MNNKRIADVFRMYVKDSGYNLNIYNEIIRKRDFVEIGCIYNGNLLFNKRSTEEDKSVLTQILRMVKVKSNE